MFIRHVQRSGKRIAVISKTLRKQLSRVMTLRTFYHNIKILVNIKIYKATCYATCILNDRCERRFYYIEQNKINDVIKVDGAQITDKSQFQNVQTVKWRSL